MKPLFPFVFALFLASCAIKGTRMEGKPASMERVLNVINKLADIAKEHRQRSDSHTHEIVRAQLKAISEPDELAKIAILANQIAFPGHIEDADYDAIFDAVLWEAVMKLSDTKGPTASRALQSIRLQATRSGDDSSHFDSFIEFQKKLQ